MNRRLVAGSGGAALTGGSWVFAARHWLGNCRPIADVHKPHSKSQNLPFIQPTAAVQKATVYRTVALPDLGAQWGTDAAKCPYGLQQVEHPARLVG